MSDTWLGKVRTSLYWPMAGLFLVLFMWGFPHMLNADPAQVPRWAHAWPEWTAIGAAAPFAAYLFWAARHRHKQTEKNRP